MRKRMEKVIAEVVGCVTPRAEERSKIQATAKRLEKKVASASKQIDLEARIRVEGSFAKDTWLSGELDIDVFMLVSPSIPRKALGDVCLRAARIATKGSKQIERFAEHPYLEAIVDGVRANIVPCYSVKLGEWLSATDRTPFHTDYVNKHLDNGLRSEVRLLKKFMKGIGVYGAEIKVGGFSGYLCELLILHYKTFVNTLDAFAKSKKRIIVDIEDHYRNRENELALLFDEPLVIVDPVDKARNVASAVQTQKLYDFIAAAQAFTKTPEIKFFYPSQTMAPSIKEIDHALSSRGSTVLFVVFDRVDTVSDVLWGQLYKSQRSLRKLLEINDFRVLRNTAWSDENTLNVFVFELEQCCISTVKRHYGPPLNKQKECEKFLAKYSHGPDVVCGPYVEGDRWAVLIKRRHSNACDLLADRLRDGGRNVGVAEGISHVLKKGFKVLVNEEIRESLRRNKSFAIFTAEFLHGRPKWLEARSV